MKENYRKYKELMKNPKYRALNKLGLWILFFGLIYLFVLLGFGTRVPVNKSNSLSKEKNALEYYANMSSFDFIYTFKYKDDYDKELKITGTFIDNKYYFNINEEEYYYKDELYLVLKETKSLVKNPQIELVNYLFDIDKDKIYEWISNSSKESETKYKDGLIITEYLYKETDANIILKVSEKNNKIIAVNLNLVDFLSTKDLHLQKFDLFIEYDNINNIDSINNNYDEYEIITESV